MASIQNRNGSYRVMWRDAGKQRSLSFDTLTQAQAYKAQVEHGLTTGLHVDPHAGGVPLSTYVDQFIGSLTVRRSTAYDYRRVWRKVEDRDIGGTALCNRHVNTLTKADCQSVLTPLSRSEAMKARTVLKQSLQIACDDRVLRANPAQGLRVPKQDKTPVEPLSAIELHAVAKAAGHYETFVLWQGLMGTRFGEAAALTRSQFRDGAVTIDRALVDVAGTRSIGPTKTGQVRTLPVPTALYERLDLGGDFVFTTVRGKQLRNSNFRRSYWLPALEKAGVSTRRVHDLRHTCASLLINKGASIKALQRWLGHSTIQQTLGVYSHLYNTELSDLSDRLDNMFYA